MIRHFSQNQKTFPFLVILLLAALITACSQPKEEPEKLSRITYVTEGTIHVAGLADGTHTEVGRGYEPSLSFDGRYLAYVADVGSKRRIAILDFPNSNTSIVEDVQGTSWRPVWSPTENRYLFSATAQNNGSSHRVVIVAHAREEKKYVISRDGIDIYSPAWAPDGETIFGHDTHFLYRWEKTGLLIGHDILTEKFGALNYNASTVILPSGEGNQWLIGIGENEPAGRPGRSPMKLFVFDELSGKLSDITPKDLIVSEAGWSSDFQSVIVAAHTSPNQRQTDLYRLSLNNTPAERIMRNASQPSCQAIEVARSNVQ